MVNTWNGFVVIILYYDISRQLIYIEILYKSGK